MNDLIELLRGRRIDGRSADEIMRLAADEIESLQSQLSYRIEERDDSNRNLTAALRREVASKDRLAKAEALLREAIPAVQSYARKHGRAVVAAARRNDADHATKHADIEKSAWSLADRIRALLSPDSASDKDRRLAALRELTQESQALGLYDADQPEAAGK